MRLQIHRAIPPRQGELPAERTKILSTGSMVNVAPNTAPSARSLPPRLESSTNSRRQPEWRRFSAVNAAAVCRFMKMTTPEQLLTSLREGTYEVTVDEEIRRRSPSFGPADDRDRIALVERRVSLDPSRVQAIPLGSRAF